MSNRNKQNIWYSPILIILVVKIILITTGCDENDNYVSEYGSVNYMTFEGGFYGIISDGGNKYLPENLDEEYKVDGLRIYFEGEVTDRPTTVQWGRTIKLERIQKLD